MTPNESLLLLEDLGEMGDYRPVYSHEQWDAETLEALASYLTVLHRVPETGKFANRAMRELNHAHIFQIPLQSDNGLDLDSIQPGLAQAAAPLLADATYVKAVAALRRAARAFSRRASQRLRAGRRGGTARGRRR